MQRLLQENSVGRVIFICATILVGVLTGITGVLGVANKVATLRDDLARLEQDFLSDQKAHLQTDVNTIINRIESQQDLQHRQLEQKLVDRAEEARDIARNIYQSINDKVAQSVVIETVKEAIRPIRFNAQQGYCFIISYNGEAILYPANASIEGTNFFTNGIGDGKTIVKNMLELTSRQGHGFLNYNWYKPGDSSHTLYPKITYVTRLEPLELLFGTGEYLDTLEDLTRNLIINELKNSWRSTLQDYYFVYQLHDLNGGPDFASMLININRPDLEGKTLSDDTVDAKGKAFRREFMEGIREHGDAFVVYWYKKPDGTGIGRKLSYFKLYPRWNWIVARGVYLDRLDADIVAKKEEQRQRVRNEILRLSCIFFLGVGLSLVLAYWFSRQLQVIFDRYRASHEQHLVELKELNRKLEAQSRIDSLTGIFNRGYFNTQLENRIEQTNRYGTDMCLLLFDIDHFKNINDSLGHLTGDEVLQELSRLIQENIRQIDLFARWGGEEFVILAPGIDTNHAMLMAEKLRNRIMAHQFPQDLAVTCSFGVGQYIVGEKSNEFIQRIDSALYEAKEQGRNRSVRAAI